MPAIILNCNCESEYQDVTYGKQKRIHTTKMKQGESTCTVCGNVKKSSK